MAGVGQGGVFSNPFIEMHSSDMQLVLTAEDVNYIQYVWTGKQWVETRVSDSQEHQSA